ncbi:MAG: VanZ family protein [Planctomycetota bacterium]
MTAAAEGPRPGPAWAAAVAYAAGIFVLSSVSLDTDSVDFEGSDKAAHVILYSGLGVFLARALRATRPRWSSLAVVMAAVVLGVLYGGSDEWHQTFVPHRMAEVGDLVADALGSLIGAFVYVLVAPPVTAPRSA